MSFFSSRQYDILLSDILKIKFTPEWFNNIEIHWNTKPPPAYHWSTLWPLEIWVRGLYNSWWFCVHELSMFIYLSMVTNMFYILFLNSGTTWISFLRKKLGNWCFCTFLNTLFFQLVQVRVLILLELQKQRQKLLNLKSWRLPSSNRSFSY